MKKVFSQAGMERNMSKHCIQLYEGNGKGKTTAAVGAAVRMAGGGGKVLFCQFLKSGTSAELSVLRQIPQIQVLEVTKSFGFTFRMTEKVKREAADFYRNYFKEAVRIAVEQQMQMLVLDEFVDACVLGFLDTDEALAALEKLREHCEVILTGHNPTVEITNIVDYHTFFEMKKHPYQEGLAARSGIEF